MNLVNNEVTESMHSCLQENNILQTCSTATYSSTRIRGWWPSTMLVTMRVQSGCWRRWSVWPACCQRGNFKINVSSSRDIQVGWRMRFLLVFAKVILTMMMSVKTTSLASKKWVFVLFLVVMVGRKSKITASQRLSNYQRRQWSLIPSIDKFIILEFGESNFLEICTDMCRPINTDMGHSLRTN